METPENQEARRKVSPGIPTETWMFNRKLKINEMNLVIYFLE